MPVCQQRAGMWLTAIMSLLFGTSAAYASPATSPSASEVPGLPEYKPSARVDGRIYLPFGGDAFHSKSNPWADNFVFWIEDFHKHQPGVRIETDRFRTAAEELIQSNATIGAKTGELAPEKLKAFERQFGHKPTFVPASVSSIAILVHRDNPIRSLTLAQLNGVFSSTRRRDAKAAKMTWGTLGLAGNWSDVKITPHGYPADQYYISWEFRQRALGGEGFADEMIEHTNAREVIAAVAKDVGAIGFVMSGDFNEKQHQEVKVVKIAAEAGKDPAGPDAGAGVYPLALFNFLVINIKPGSQLDARTGEFVRYVLSREGQKRAAQSGFAPITPAVAAEQLRRLRLSEPKT